MTFNIGDIVISTNRKWLERDGTSNNFLPHCVGMIAMVKEIKDDYVIFTWLEKGNPQTGCPSIAFDYLCKQNNKLIKLIL